MRGSRYVLLLVYMFYVKVNYVYVGDMNLIYFFNKVDVWFVFEMLINEINVN